MANLKVATWNLYQFAEPGTYWYERDERNDYETDQWEAKKAWIRNMLAELDADVVGFQEIFSVDAFRTFMAEEGYPHIATVAEPARDDDDTDVFIGPITGIASRHPFASEPAALEFPSELSDRTILEDSATFRRAITRCEIDTPQLGPVVVYACHFKSQGAFIDSDVIAEEPDWKSRFREHFKTSAIKDSDQLFRRTADAAGTYLAVLAELEADNGKPIIVVGDMNDKPSSPTLRILTQNQELTNIAGRRRSAIEEASDRAWYYRWRLFDAHGLANGQQSGPRPVTHPGGWNYPPETLDYILVSNALNRDNPQRIASVTRLDVYSDHLEDLDRLLTSDHAPVMVTITPKAEEASS
ncbi:MAG: endonuclease/exonuclease/phosphatase family protein [Pseudomonadota bacterium]